MYYSNSTNNTGSCERISDRCQNCCSSNRQNCCSNCRCSNNCCSNCGCGTNCCTNPSVTVGNTVTGAPGTAASVTNSGTDCNAVLNFTIPAGQNGQNGTSATVTVGSTTTGAPGTPASVTNSGTAQNAILNFTIPAGQNGTNGTDGKDGTPATVTVGTTTTGAPGTNASVTNSGTAQNAVLNFTIPAGQNGTDGKDGTPATVTVGTTTTGAPGTPATVTNSGTAQNAVLNFTIPAGKNGTDGTDGKDGTPATVTVGTTTTGAPGTNASVTNSGTAQNAVLNFTIPAGKNGTDGTDGADGTPATVSIGTTTTGTPGTNAFVTNTGTQQDAVLNFTIPAGKDGKDGKDGTNGLASYGGLYSSKNQTAKPASAAAYQQVQLDSAMPLSNVNTGLNNLTIGSDGNYEISYSIGIASKCPNCTRTSSSNTTFTLAIRKNGTAIPQTVCTANIAPDQNKQNYYHTSYVTLAKNDILDLAFQVNDTSGTDNLVIYPNADCSLTIKKLS